MTKENNQFKIPNSSISKLAWFLILLIIFPGCGNSNEKTVPHIQEQSKNAPATVQKNKDEAVAAKVDSATKLGEIPILCYHQIRDWKSSDSKYQRVYIMPVANFKEQIQMLRDSGYHAILPDQLIAYMEKGEPLPSRPVMLTFDDAPLSQYETGLPELNKAGFKAVFFIMTVVLGHNNYMTKDDVKKLSEQGHIIGSHTWNHEMVTKYKKDADWELQIVKPRAELEKIIGMPVKYFAYPYGIWNAETAAQIKKYGFTAAFQLYKKQDQNEKLFSIRRIIVDPYWNGKQFMNYIRNYSKPKS